MDEQKVRQIIREELSDLLGDKAVFQKHIQMLDGRNIQVGRETGTMIGTEGYVGASDLGQKIGFYGTTPVVQGATATTVADVISRLQDLGLIQ